MSQRLSLGIQTMNMCGYLNIRLTYEAPHVHLLFSMAWKVNKRYSIRMY